MKRGGLPRGVSEYFDQHGKPRVRGRRTGWPTYYFKSRIGTPDFWEEYRTWSDGAAARPQVGISRTRAGSMSDVIARYYRSAEWAGLGDSTKTTYRGIIERFRTEHGHRLVSEMQREHVKRIIAAKAQTPAAANNLLRMIRLLIRFAMDEGMRRDDPTVGLKGVRNKSEGFHTWTDEEIAQFEAKHAIGTRARLALALMLYTGQRRSDAVTMGRQHVKDGRIRVRQQKTGVELNVPIHPALADIIAASTADNMTFLVTSFGKPFTAAGFGGWFRECCDEAGLPQCSSHGLRKAASRRLAEAGCSVHQIAAITGHKTLKEIERYTRAVEQAKLADSAMKTIAQAEAPPMDSAASTKREYAHPKRSAEREQKLANVDLPLAKSVKK